MNILKINKNENLFLDNDKIYCILYGRAVIRSVFSNGKMAMNEFILVKGDIVGNFFKLYDVYKNMTDDIAIEIEALEETKLIEESMTELKNNLKMDSFQIVKLLMEQMLKKQLINIYHHAYDKHRYLLFILLLHTQDDGTVEKSILNYRFFNLSRSQFFSTFNVLKNKKIITKIDQTVKVNRKKAEKYLNLCF